MVQLFLSEVDITVMRDSESAKLLAVLFNQLETAIWSAVVSSGCRSEARLWLCNSVSKLKSLSPRSQADLFVTLVKSKPLNQMLASQILQMIIEKRPYIVGHSIAKRSHILERFFRGHPKRVSEWFSSFDTGGGSDHKRGAKALSQFAFVNRDICWEELEWKGKHGQSPAMVATKPHYFLDLDIQKTIRNFLDYVPEFWSSKEFAESLKDGEIFSIDRQYFLDIFIDFMFKDDSRDIWEVIEVFLREEPFSSLCQRLLIGLEECDFCIFLKFLGKYLRPEKESKDDNSNLWLEMVLSQYGDLKSIDELLLMNAVINYGRHLLRLMHADEYKEKEKIGDIVSQISKALGQANSFSSFLKACISMKNVETVRFLGLNSWVVHYRLSEECRDLDSWENLFISNDITFRKSCKYSMLDSGSEATRLESSPSIGFKTKRKERKRKRRRNYDHEDNYDDLLEFDKLNEDRGSQCTVGSWLLSTDGFASSWTNADLPEHLAKHCFSVWIKWVLK